VAFKTEGALKTIRVRHYIYKPYFFLRITKISRSFLSQMCADPSANVRSVFLRHANFISYLENLLFLRDFIADRDESRAKKGRAKKWGRKTRGFLQKTLLFIERKKKKSGK